MTRRLIVIRHGNTFAPGDTIRRIGARTDLPLVASGVAQAEALADALAPYAPDHILTGPLTRTRATAEVIARGRPATIADWLAEIDHGPDEGLAESAVVARIGAETMTRWDIDAVPPPGWIVNAEALIAGWRAILALPGTTLAITSNGVARFALRAIAAASPGGGKLRTGAYGVVEDGKLIGWDLRPGD